MLVSIEDPQLYCVGEMKQTSRNKEAFDRFQQRYKHGTTVIMTKVAFAEYSKTQYISSSLRVNINMAATTLTTVFAPPSAVQPVPATSVAETKSIQQNQNFDLMAFILNCSNMRAGGEDRKAFDVELGDGSKDTASQKVQTLSLTIFADSRQATAMFDFVKKWCEEHVPVTFFNISGMKQAGADVYSFTSARRGFSIIKSESVRATQMQELAPELYNLSDKAPLPQQQWTPNENFASRSGIVTTIKLLQAMATPVDTNIEEIDTESTVWQLNWCQIVEPSPGASLRTTDGSRLWFQVVLRDFHGTMTMPMTEAAALKCAKQESAAKLEAAHTEGRLCFPIVASVKILRKKGANARVDHCIVDADEQDYAQAPTTKTLDLFVVLHGHTHDKSVEQPADTFLPASLGDIETSLFYPLTVRYTAQTAVESPSPANREAYVCHCTSVLALVVSTEASKKESINDVGTTVITHGVKDMLAEDDRTYTLTAHCTTDTHMDFILSPPKRASQQAALVVICGTLDDSRAEKPVSNFLVESVQPLHAKDAELAKASMLKLISLIVAGGRTCE